MAEKRDVIINVKSTGVDTLDSNLNKVESSFKKVQTEANNTSTSVENVTKNGGAIAILDKLTGGLASSFRDAFEATKLFNTSLAATRTALIATGIGALVAGVAALILYWDDVVDFISGANRALKEQLDLNEKIKDSLTIELTLLQEKQKLLEDAGESTTENLAQQQKINSELLKTLESSVKIKQEQLEIAKNKKEELGLWTRIQVLSAKIFTSQALGNAIAEAENDKIVKARIDGIKKVQIEIVKAREEELRLNKEITAEILNRYSLSVPEDAAQEKVKQALLFNISVNKQNLNNDELSYTARRKALAQYYKDAKEVIQINGEEANAQIKSIEEARAKNEKDINDAKAKNDNAEVTRLQQLDKLLIDENAKANIKLNKLEIDKKAISNDYLEAKKKIDDEEIASGKIVGDNKEFQSKRELELTTSLIKNDEDRINAQLKNIDIFEKVDLKRVDNEQKNLKKGTDAWNEAEAEKTTIATDAWIARQILLDNLQAIQDQKDEDKKATERSDALEKASADAENLQLSFEERRAAELERRQLLLSDEELTLTERQLMIDDFAHQDIETARLVEEAKANIQQSALDTAAKGFALLGKMAGKNKSLQIAAIIGENAMGIAKQIIATRAANALVTAKYAPLPGGAAFAKIEKTINNVGLGIGIASSVLATRNAIKALGGGGSASGGSGAGGSGAGGSEPVAPQFNVVGAGSTNQLAQSISEERNQPIKAFVVSSDITTQQALDRNIENTTTFG